VLIVFFYTGCSNSKVSTAWQNTQRASYVAVTDPVTWGSALGAVALYATYDDDITEHYMENNLFDSEIDERLRKINNLTMYVTALTVSNDTNVKRGQRLATNFAGAAVARRTTTTLNKIIKKDIPSGDDNYAIGSHHALDPFAKSALTRRNVSDMTAPLWLKYSINSLSYISASGSAFSRIQEGGHSFADQLVSVSIGNFVGLFFYELFLVDGSNLQSIHTSLVDHKLLVSTTWTF